MQVTIVDIEQDGQILPEWLKAMPGNTEVILTRGSIPIARVLPISNTKSPRIPGLHLKAAWVSPDFDEPLGPEYWSDL
jgi:antitoxin (DNA-binding transcriptional repressor) of toxin-antitoxin stability system